MKSSEKLINECFLKTVCKWCVISLRATKIVQFTHALKIFFLESEHGNNHKKLKVKRNQNNQFYPIRPNKLWNHRYENNKSYSETSDIFTDIGSCSQLKIVM